MHDRVGNVVIPGDHAPWRNPTGRSLQRFPAWRRVGRSIGRDASVFARLFRSRPGGGDPPPRRPTAPSSPRRGRPALYAGLGVPDSVTGRFEMVVLHTILVIGGCAQDGPAGAALGQLVFDDFCRDMDQSLRELGFGDMAVPKRMKKLGESFYGRAEAYGRTLADRQGLAAAIAAQRVSGRHHDGRRQPVGRLRDCRRGGSGGDAPRPGSARAGWPFPIRPFSRRPRHERAGHSFASLRHRPPAGDRDRSSRSRPAPAERAALAEAYRSGGGERAVGHGDADARRPRPGDRRGAGDGRYRPVLRGQPGAGASSTSTRPFSVRFVPAGSAAAHGRRRSARRWRSTRKRRIRRRRWRAPPSTLGRWSRRCSFWRSTPIRAHRERNCPTMAAMRPNRSEESPFAVLRGVVRSGK